MEEISSVTIEIDGKQAAFKDEIARKDIVATRQIVDESLAETKQTIDETLAANIEETKRIVEDSINDMKIIHYDGVIIGDSLSKGDDGQSYKGHANIKDWLVYFTRRNIVDNGIWGDSLDGITSRFKEDVLNYYPEFCIVLCGTNDLTNGLGTNVMVNKARNLIEIMIKNRIIPIMISIPPRNDKPEINVKIREYNSKLQYICEKLNAKFVDVYSILCTRDGNAKEYVLTTNDNLHWTSYGAYTCAKAIYDSDFIKSNTSLKNNTLCRLWSDTLYENFEITQFDSVASGELAHYYKEINTGGATFSKELRNDIPITLGYDYNYQVITKPATDTSTQAGIYYEPYAYVVGATYRTELDFEFKITDHTDDANTCFVCCLTIWYNDSSTPTTYHKFVEAYGLQEAKATVFFDCLIPLDKRKMRLEVYGIGKSGFVLKTGRFNAHPLG